jgi:hypothetical protein
MIFIPENYSDESKIWVYQSNRIFNSNETAYIGQNLDSFLKNWVSHSNQLKAFGSIFKNQIIVLIVDESLAMASGCSIDSSVNFIKQIGQQLEIDFFNRWNFLYLNNDQNIQLISKDDLRNSLQEGTINFDTPFIDPLVKTLKEFKNGFIKPLGESWHKNFLNV